MIRISYLLFFVFLFEKADTQNLIRNASFEEYTLCPSAPGLWNYLIDWNNPTNSTPDYFNSCCTNTNASIPYNISSANGFQPALDGNGYIHLVSYFSSNQDYRDYLQQELTLELISTKKYCGSFYVSLGNWCKYSIETLGIYISDSAISCSSLCLLNFTPQINNTGVQLNDTLGWQKISNCFVASGNEKFITIGNFFTNSMSNAQLFDTLSTYETAQYYFDKLSLSLCRPPILGDDTVHINLGESIIIGDTAEDVATYQWYPSTGLSNPLSWQTSCSVTENTTYTLEKITPCDTTYATKTVVVHQEYFNVFPNPADGAIQISYGLLKDVKGSVQVYDAIGKLIYQQELKQYSGTEVLDIVLASGAYFIILQSGDVRLYTRKVVVTK